MLCDSCLSLIRDADNVISFDDPEWDLTITDAGTTSSFKCEVYTEEFQQSVDQKCYLCTRLFNQLGAEKWKNILHSLPRTHVVAFDKSIEYGDLCSFRMRLGCKLTPILESSKNGRPALLGKGYSYGWVQVKLEVQGKR
jgi:hypothetical protein